MRPHCTKNIGCIVLWRQEIEEHLSWSVSCRYHDREKLNYPPSQKLRYNFFYVSYDDNSISFGKFDAYRFSGMFFGSFWMIFHYFQTFWKKSFILTYGQFARGQYEGRSTLQRIHQNSFVPAIKLYWFVIWRSNYYQSMLLSQENIFHMHNISQK